MKDQQMFRRKGGCRGGRGREKYEGIGRRTEGKRRGWVGKKGEGPKEREGVG